MQEQPLELTFPMQLPPHQRPKGIDVLKRVATEGKLWRNYFNISSYLALLKIKAEKQLKKAKGVEKKERKPISKCSDTTSFAYNLF